MIKTKLLIGYASKASIVKEKLNRFIEDKKVVDIKFQLADESQSWDTLISFLVIYEEVE